VNATPADRAVPADLPRIEVDVDRGIVCGVPIEFGAVAAELKSATVSTHILSANSHQVLFQAFGARVLVESGQRIVVDLEPGFTVDDVRFLTYGWLPSLIMLQRGCVFLHASTVSSGDVTLAITGRSGSGKSTTAAALCAQGWVLHCDDTTPIVVRDGVPWIIPYARPIHLLPDALDRVDPEAPRRMLPSREKLAVDVDQDLTPRPLTALAEVVSAAEVTSKDGVEFERISGLDIFRLLERNLHVRRAAVAGGDRSELMNWLEVMSGLAVVRIRRQSGVDTLGGVCARIDTEPLLR
jgi:hypothetical protein